MNGNIPKKIHYCWFGRNPLPELAEKCLSSWREHLPDYEIIKWNEDNFDIDSHIFVKEAYEAKKFAFVSDYVRLYALYNFGGIYMDTDVEVLKSIDNFLFEDAFSGFEDETRIPTAIMGCKPKHAFFRELIDYYEGRHFIKPDGTPDMTTNVDVITNICLGYGFKPNNEKQTICNMTFYPKEYFCPLTYNSFKVQRTVNTHTIHHFSGSWHEDYNNNLKRFFRRLFQRAMKGIKRIIIKIAGDRIYSKLKNMRRI